MPLQTERGVKKAVAQAIADAMRKRREQDSAQALKAEATEDSACKLGGRAEPPWSL